MRTRVAVLRKAGTPRRVGDVAVVFGTGGVGMNAVQGARYAGAKYVFAIDPNPWKQEQALDFGATHAFGDPVKAKEVLIDLTRGPGRDSYRLPQKNAALIVRWRQPTLRHPDDPGLVARGPHQAF